MNSTNQHIDDCLYEVYTGHGVQFRYPGAWAISETRQSDEVTIQVESGDTSFWSLTLLFERPEPAEVIDAVSQAFRDEYPELDLYPSQEQLNGLPTWGCDIEFVSFELVNSAFVRCFQGDTYTGLVLFQGTDHELEATQAEMEAITRSFVVIENEEGDNPAVGLFEDE